MPSIMQILYVAPTLLAAAYAQGVITNAQGNKGSPASVGLQVDLTKADANVINANELSTNVVNECGRTLLAGNIDIGTVTEAALVAKQVTAVTKGSTMTVNIKALDANGAGPYTCDVDQTSNASGVSGQVPLTVKETTAKNGDVTLAVTMPKDLACIGASTGDICTVRCFNKAAAGPFGGCVAVQQTDITPTKNSPDQIASAQTLDGINQQIAQNIKDLPAAAKAIQDAPTEEQQALFAANALLGIDATASATAGAAGVAATGTAATPAANNGNGNGKGKGKGNGATKGNGAASGGATRGGNGNAAAKGNGNANAATNGNGAAAAGGNRGFGRFGNNNKKRSRVFRS